METIIKTMIFYDCPRLFISKMDDKLYLGIWIEEKENSDIYYYIPISDENFNINKILKLNDKIYEVEKFNNGDEPIIKEILTPQSLIDFYKEV